MPLSAIGPRFTRTHRHTHTHAHTTAPPNGRTPNVAKRSDEGIQCKWERSGREALTIDRTDSIVRSVLLRNLITSDDDDDADAIVVVIISD